uniref:Carbohydrate-binding domain-containing protein n=1 Tax=uncultured bacterium contig00088 TaxID=1181561 RepID=A0A806KH90_9BACT|nr:hypothetical protein [uncultured bacterium contig00088]
MPATIDLSVKKPAAQGDGWTFADDVYTVLSGADVTVTGSNKGSRRRIAVAEEAQDVRITLDGVTIALDDTDSADALFLNRGASVTLVLAGENTVTVKHLKARCIDTRGKTSLTITGEGSLTASSGGTVIGGDDIIINDGKIRLGADRDGAALKGIHITINGGDIFAGGREKGKFGGYGIMGRDTGNVTVAINGGTVTAEGCRDCAAIDGAIIAISGGTVHATSKGYGAAIGGTVASVGGKGTSGGTVIINGGNVTAVCEKKKEGAGIGAGADAVNGGTLIMEGNAVVFTSSLEHYKAKRYGDGTASGSKTAIKTNTGGVTGGTLFVGNRDRPFFQG